MSKPYVLGIDPSGSFNEGKGTTGFAFLGPKGQVIAHTTIEAKNFESQIDYWFGVLGYMRTIINKYKEHPWGIVVSVEDYVLYASSARAQINSELETSKLIGAITVAVAESDVKMFIRSASQVMNRWSNDILEFKGLIQKKGNRWCDMLGSPINPHSMDAIRHAVHCHYFEVDKK